MAHQIDLDSSGFSEEEFADVKKCLETLMSIRAGSQPLDRDFGIDYDAAIGLPTNVAENMLSLEIIDKVEKYEPRVEVTSVTYDENTDGQIAPHVHFVKAEGI